MHDGCMSSDWCMSINLLEGGGHLKLLGQTVSDLPNKTRCYVGEFEGGVLF